ncbi:hypothetical protein N7523_007858 [Penicillium sp. IBT 18751x]|nr:hypothetical protein N7523_007858 [Penicillium sp. IBT 18751x]
MSAKKWAIATRFAKLSNELKTNVYGDLSIQKLAKAEIINEELTNDILKRLSPYLQQNTPIDILDLWPSTGIFSSQVNKYLKPRRHLLVEPNKKYYGKSLTRLVKSGGGYEMVSLDPYSLYDWSEVFAKYLPEQGPSNMEGQVLPRNNTLLVLANLPEQRSTRDHFTPARWWSVMMESCLNQRGVHMYGSVRILASLPGNTKCSVFPRTVIDRRRTSMLTETVAQHAFEVASTYENETWQSLKSWDNLMLSRNRVAERTAANNIITPAGREIPPLELAPESPRPGKLSQVYMPRPRVEWHDTVMDRIAKESSTNKVVKRDAQAALYSLNLDNKQAWWCHHVAKMELEEDEASRSLARIAADTSKYTEELQRADKRCAGMRDTVEKLLKGTHHRVIRGHDRVTDDGRLLKDAGSLDNSMLIHDRRPFEALRIHPDDQFPRLPRTFVYFEADPNPPVVQKLSQLSDEKRVEVLELFDTLSSIFSTRDQLTLAELYNVIFPLRTANEIVKEFPSLAKYAMKRLKPGYGTVALPDPTLDPNECFQENIDYDLSHARIRRLPVSLIWDILLQYQNSGPDVSPMQFNRLLGGTLTGAATGGASGNSLKLR